MIETRAADVRNMFGERKARVKDYTKITGFRGRIEVMSTEGD